MEQNPFNGTVKENKTKGKKNLVLLKYFFYAIGILVKRADTFFFKNTIK